MSITIRRVAVCFPGFLVLALILVAFHKQMKPGHLGWMQGMDAHDTRPSQAGCKGCTAKRKGIRDNLTHTASPRIPHIIHQTWDSHQVPVKFKNWILSWRRHHPTWEYWFWTPREVRLLLKHHFSEYLALYESYPLTLNRADVMRYFILFQYGGVYVDLDMECLKPIDPWTYNTTCFASEETLEHAYFLYKRNESEIMNTLLACRPGHPFFALLHQELPKHSHLADELYATGPFFVHEAYMKYTGNRTRLLPVNDTLTALHPDFFLPTHDPAYSFQTMCMQRVLTVKQKELCELKRKRNFANEPLPWSYATHYWTHVILHDQKWKTSNTCDIKDLVPGVTLPKP